MLKSERYASVLVFSLIIGGLIFCFASIYTQMYHVTSYKGMTVSVINNDYSAKIGVHDIYPYYPEKNQFFGEQFNSGNASQVIQWALDNSNEVQFTQGNYYLYNTVYVDSYSCLDGGTAKFFIDIKNGVVFNVNGYHIKIMNFWIRGLP